jgi:flagellar hook-associated protein 3 FlgL
MGSSIISIYDNLSYALNLHTQAIAKLQEEGATGNRVNRGSDSPSDAYRILGLNTQSDALESYKDNVSNLTSTFQISSTVIESMASQLSSTQTVLAQIVGGIYDEEGQKRIADKINNTLEQLVSQANTQQASQYLFGGNNTGTAPYAVQRENGKIVSVTYQGSKDARRVDVAPGLDMESTLVGDDVFRSQNRKTPEFTGSTGAAAGTGTSTVTGDVWLTVQKNGSTYQLSIDDGASFVDVPASGDTNLAVTDSRTGQVLYVDTTGITEEGTELVRVPGTYDVFSSLISLRDMLLNDRGLSTQTLLDTVTEAGKSIEEVRNLLVQADVSTGSKSGFLSTLSDTLDSMAANTDDQKTKAQEADVAQISIDLARRSELYQMSLSVAGKIISTSLLDFID